MDHNPGTTPAPSGLPNDVSAVPGAAAVPNAFPPAQAHSVPALPAWGWVGFDLDRTLAHYDHWMGPEHIGAPVPYMVDKLKSYLAAGIKCKIFTARVYSHVYRLWDRSKYPTVTEIRKELAQHEALSKEKPAFAISDDFRRVYEGEMARRYIEDWCLQHVGVVLECTAQKDWACVEFWDDIARQAPINGGVGLQPFTVFGEHDEDGDPFMLHILASDEGDARRLTRDWGIKYEFDLQDNDLSRVDVEDWTQEPGDDYEPINIRYVCFGHAQLVPDPHGLHGSKVVPLVKRDELGMMVIVNGDEDSSGN